MTGELDVVVELATLDAVPASVHLMFELAVSFDERDGQRCPEYGQ